jgi:hypothetical protein
MVLAVSLCSLFLGEVRGHAELAEHFRQERWHPKGCWAVDLILAKT